MKLVNRRSVHIINFCGGAQVIALESATALILDRCGQMGRGPRGTATAMVIQTRLYKGKKLNSIALDFES